MPASEVPTLRKSTSSGGEPELGVAVQRAVGGFFTSSGAIRAHSKAPPTAPTPPPIAAASRRSSRSSVPWCQFEATPPPTAPSAPPATAHTTGVALPNVSYRLAQPVLTASAPTDTRAMSLFMFEGPPEMFPKPLPAAADRAPAPATSHDRNDHEGAAAAQVATARPHHDWICALCKRGRGIKVCQHCTCECSPVTMICRSLPAEEGGRQRAMSSGWMATVVRNAALLLALGALCAPAPSAQAAQSFDSFCAEWMGKLAKRESDNVSKVKYSNEGGRVVGNYTGYDSAPVRCQSKAQPGKPGVGTLVYNELHYRKAGDSVESAKKSSPVVVERVEVMEIFRFDGSAWKY